MTCNGKLMLFCEGFCNIFEVFHCVFQHFMFILTPHAPNMYKWANFPSTRGIMNHKMVFRHKVFIRIQVFEQRVMFHNQMF